MNWQTTDSLPQIEDRQIIVSAWSKELKSYVYNVVSYYSPLAAWYGGPGVVLKKGSIRYWSEIPPPKD